MPQPTDKSETNTLPDTELNPLLNPLLAENLGRWAEVYFNSPPEKRAEAVSELLRELQSGSPSTSASIQTIPDKKPDKERKTEAVPDLTPTAVEALRACSACGHSNSPAQKFCGMCGVPLQISPEFYPSKVADDLTFAAAAPLRDSSQGVNHAEPAIEPAVSSITSGGGDSAPESPWTLPYRSLPSFAIAPESEPVPYRYRLYIGVVLAFVLALLLYMAWRGTRTISGVGEARSAASRPIAPPAEPTALPQASATESAPPEANPLDSPGPSEKGPPANSQTNQTTAARPASPEVIVAANSSDQSGTEELTTAERYLSGSPGRPRDSREASLWLWKAVGKGNVAATLALSDLYLRGDGVPKSCDQGRLLLDAAARKGGKAAAERLRHLQAFGCE